MRSVGRTSRASFSLRKEESSGRTTRGEGDSEIESGEDGGGLGVGDWESNR